MRDGQVKERLTPEHTNYVRKLCGMANDLNQLAHKANAAGFVTVGMGVICVFVHNIYPQ